MFAMAYVGVLLNITEVISYLVLFRYLYVHDNTVAISVLRPEVIKVRNSRNAISLAGQLVTWILETSYFLLLIFYMNFAVEHSERSREVASIFKLLEFTLIPLAQVLTSAPLKKFVSGKNWLQQQRNLAHEAPYVLSRITLILKLLLTLPKPSLPKGSKSLWLSNLLSQLNNLWILMESMCLNENVKVQTDVWKTRSFSKCNVNVIVTTCGFAWSFTWHHVGITLKCLGSKNERKLSMGKKSLLIHFCENILGEKRQFVFHLLAIFCILLDFLAKNSHFRQNSNFLRYFAFANFFFHLTKVIDTYRWKYTTWNFFGC